MENYARLPVRIFRLQPARNFESGLLRVRLVLSDQRRRSVLAVGGNLLEDIDAG